MWKLGRQVAKSTRASGAGSIEHSIKFTSGCELRDPLRSGSPSPNLEWVNSGAVTAGGTSDCVCVVMALLVVSASLKSKSNDALKLRMSTSTIISPGNPSPAPVWVLNTGESEKSRF